MCSRFRFSGDSLHYFSFYCRMSMMNFIYGMIVEGKTMASQPMFAINPNAFDSTQDDFYDVFPGKIFRMKTGESVNDAFRPVIVPDVTSTVFKIDRSEASKT